MKDNTVIPERPAIKKSLLQLRLDNKTIQLRSGIDREVITFSGDTPEDIIISSIPLLNGKNTVKEIVEKSSFSEKQIIRLINMFKKADLLEDNELQEKDFPCPAFKEINFLKNFEDYPEKLKDKISRTSLAVINEGKIGEITLELLKNAGFYPEVTDFNDREKLSSADFIVVSSDFISPHLLKKVNIFCIKNKIPWIKGGEFQGYNYGTVGPTFVPEKTACYNCYHMRMKSNLQYYEDYIKYEEYLEKEKNPHSYPCPESFKNILAGFTVMETINFLLKLQSPLTEGKIYRFNFQTSTGETENILPLPTCEACGAKTHLFLSTLMGNNKNNNVIKGNMEILQGSTAGIITSLKEIIPSEDEPPIFRYKAKIVRAERLGGQEVLIFSSGAGVTQEEAKKSAIGEALERYCSSFYEQGGFIWCNYKLLKKEAVSPEDFGLFSKNQYKKPGFSYEPFRKDTDLYWVRAYSLKDKKDRFIPACMAYLFYKYSPGEGFITPLTSNGLAAGPSPGKALLSGIYECIERDAFMLFWLKGLRVPAIKTDEIKDKNFLSRYEKFLNLPGYEYTAFDITTDIDIPSVAVFCRAKTSAGAILCVGAASREDPYEALGKAIMEALQNIPYIKYLIKTNSEWKYVEDFSNIQTFHDHALLYTKRPDLLENLKFLNPANYRTLPEKSAESATELERCTKKLFKRGYDILFKNITTVDVAGGGITVVRVIIPGLLSINPGRYSFLGGKRLKKYKKAKSDFPGIGGKYNPYPHPFP